MADTVLADKIRKIADDLVMDCRLAIDFGGRLYDVADAVSAYERLDANVVTRNVAIDECIAALKEEFGSGGGHCGESTSEIIGRQRREAWQRNMLEVLEGQKLKPIQSEAA